jgi:zinc transport system substrate-binding protein
LLSCGGDQDHDAADRAAQPAGTSVYVVNYPLQYFAERIGGDAVEVVFPAPAGGDPAFWAPGATQLADYQQATLILLNGAGYAKWVESVSLPTAKLVDTSASFAEAYISTEEAVTHRHGPEGEHEHGAIAFTTWLDPTLAVQQAGAVAQAFAGRWPEHAPAFEERLAALAGDLMALDRRLEAVFADARDLPLLFSHPVYQYFARRYGLNARSVHWEPDEAPSPAMWAELDAVLAEHPARWMIWEGEPAASTVEKLRERGVGSLVFEPCGNVPAGGDYLTVMERNVAALEAAFSPE